MIAQQLELRALSLGDFNMECHSMFKAFASKRRALAPEPMDTQLQTHCVFDRWADHWLAWGLVGGQSFG
jgi:hypothetical protein